MAFLKSTWGVCFVSVSESRILMENTISLILESKERIFVLELLHYGTIIRQLVTGMAHNCIITVHISSSYEDTDRRTRCALLSNGEYVCEFEV